MAKEKVAKVAKNTTKRAKKFNWDDVKCGMAFKYPGNPNIHYYVGEDRRYEPDDADPVFVFTVISVYFGVYKNALFVRKLVRVPKKDRCKEEV